MLIVGLTIGIVIGYGVGSIVGQPQISQLQSDLSKMKSTRSQLLSDLSAIESSLSTSQSEVDLLHSQLTETSNSLTATEAELSNTQTTIASLEAQLRVIDTRLSEHVTLKTDVTSIVNYLTKKIALEKQIIKMWIHHLRGESAEFATTQEELEPFVDAVGDSELSTFWDEFLTHSNAAEYSEADDKFADLMTRTSNLIESDLKNLETIIAG